MASIQTLAWDLPAYSSHEHIGSIPPAGMVAKWGFQADLVPGCPCGEVGLMDLILSPYLRGLLMSVGFRLPKTPEPLALWKSVQPFLRKCRGTGLFMALDEAMGALYDLPLRAVSDGGDEVFLRADGAVREAYRAGLYLHNRAVFKRAHLAGAVKPVHIGYLQRLMENSRGVEAEIETQDFTPILRVDDLLGFLDRDGTADWSHAEGAFNCPVRTCEDIELMVSRAFELVDALHIPAIKQLQAYARSLQFGCPSREEALNATNGVGWRSDAARVRIVQDYAMHCVLRQASARRMPFQIHAGMANLPHSNPAGLCSIVEQYPEVRFVLLHCYPYQSEAAYMARVYPNVWLDAAWLALQSPALLKRTLDEWIGFVPYEKLFLSADATNSEECFGAYAITRRVLAQALDEKKAAGEMDAELAEDIARALLYGNARNQMGIGTR